MLDYFDDAGIESPDTEDIWTSQKQPRMNEEYLPSPVSTLQDFGSQLYDRMHILDSDRHIELAIQKVERVLAVMRFCHVIIIT